MLANTFAHCLPPTLLSNGAYEEYCTLDQFSPLSWFPVRSAPFDPKTHYLRVQCITSAIGDTLRTKYPSPTYILVLLATLPLCDFCVGFSIIRSHQKKTHKKKRPPFYPFIFRDRFLTSLPQPQAAHLPSCSSTTTPYITT